MVGIWGFRVLRETRGRHQTISHLGRTTHISTELTDSQEEGREKEVKRKLAP